MIPKSLLVVLSMALAAKGDLYSNGQYFGPGIIIIDAPAPNSPFQVNSTMPIAIDVSLDGKITNQQTVNRVSIFLTNPGFNLTVQNPLDLTSEPGSTVLHPNWLIDSCVPAGDYNLSFYEIDTISGTQQFSAINIPISINTPAGWIHQPSCPNNLQTTSSGSSSNTSIITNAAIANKCSISTASIILFAIYLLV